MKFAKIILLICLISSIKSFGQNYQTVVSDRIAFFENQQKNVNSLRIDSVTFHADSILYPFTVIQQISDECYSVMKASWIGPKIIIEQTGVNYFFNSSNDTIILNTTAKLSDKWIAFRMADSLIIEATVIGHDTLSFLGVNDSVKTIGFQAYDKKMTPLNLDINNVHVLISQNYGFVKTLNFFSFPFQNSDAWQFMEEHHLIGISHPKMGFQNLTWMEVHDFQVGDEFHVLEENRYLGDGYTVKSIYKYLERNDYPDSIVYTYSLLKSRHSNLSFHQPYEFIDDVFKEVIKPDAEFDKLPGEPNLGNGFASNNSFMKNSTPFSKFTSWGFDYYVISNDSCWHQVHTDWHCLFVYEYIKGFGGPYYYCDHSVGKEERTLVYSKKGEISQGTPLVITGVPDTHEMLQIKIFPNPATGYVNVVIANGIYSDYSISLYDVQGRMVKSLNLEMRNAKLDISEFVPGLYVVKIRDKEAIIKVEKLVIR
jgi:hypothetical protein